MKKILITAGPTREKIDAVRFLSNRSSGKMGYALAAAARDAGLDVTLVSGPVALAPVDGVTTVRIESAAEMAEAVKSRAPEMDIVIMAAAVSVLLHYLLPVISAGFSIIISAVISSVIAALLFPVDEKERGEAAQ